MTKVFSRVYYSLLQTWCIIVNCFYIFFISICYISDVSKKMEGQSDAPPQYFHKVMKGRNVVINSSLT